MAEAQIAPPSKTPGASTLDALIRQTLGNQIAEIIRLQAENIDLQGKIDSLLAIEAKR